MSDHEQPAGHEAASSRFIQFVESHAYGEPERPTLDSVSQGAWNLDVLLPLVGIHIKKVTFEVGADLDEYDRERTGGRSHHIEYLLAGGQSMTISLRPSHDDRFIIYPAEEVEDPWEIADDDAVHLLAELAEHEDSGRMTRAN